MQRALVSLLFAVLLGGTLGAIHETERASLHEVLRNSEAAVSQFPGFPKSYEAAYTFTLPYTSVFSPSPVKYPVRMWVNAEDANNTLLRVDDHDGLNKKIHTKEWVYTVNPRLDTVMCSKEKPKPDHQIQLQTKDRGLPHDMGNWTYKGRGTYESEPCDVYLLTETFFEREAFYTLYVSLDGSPLFLSALGQNYFTGAHYDEYLAYFTDYIPGVPDDSVFEPPEECGNTWNTVELPAELQQNRPLHMQLDFLIPRITQWHPEYDAFIMNHGRLHSSPIEYEDRLQIFLRNKEHIERHNARNDATYTLELNKYADWTDEEFMSLKTGHLQESDEVDAFLRENAEVFVDYTNDEVPSNFSWYGTPADGVVKDQAVCGSCWAFSATETLKGAWYVATNESLSFSEQQLVDCAWNYFNYACEGGFVSMAVVYAIQNGGVSSEMMYGYKGHDDYCVFDAAPAAQFSTVGMVNKFEPELVKKALIAHGPLGVSMDAGHLDFRFYKDGIFVQPECKANKTNHAVALVGYGSEDGHDYWLIKNSWSTFWGDKGYIKMDTKYDCGVTYRPVYAVADSAAAAKRREELHQRQG